MTSYFKDTRCLLFYLGFNLCVKDYFKVRSIRNLSGVFRYDNWVLSSGFLHHLYIITFLDIKSLWTKFVDEFSCFLVFVYIVLLS